MTRVHKDFHGALSYGLRFLQEHYGEAGLREFLTGLAETVYAPLVEDLRARGLPALRDHWQRVFDLEDGEIEMTEDDGALTLAVHRCPAITHMRERGYAVAECFCEHTRLVNEGICRAAGYRSEVTCDQETGRCVQRFWREAR